MSSRDFQLGCALVLLEVWAPLSEQRLNRSASRSSSCRLATLTQRCSKSVPGWIWFGRLRPKFADLEPTVVDFAQLGPNLPDGPTRSTLGQLRSSSALTRLVSPRRPNFADYGPPFVELGPLPASADFGPNLVNFRRFRAGFGRTCSRWDQVRRRVGQIAALSTVSGKYWLAFARSSLRNARWVWASGVETGRDPGGWTHF